MTICVDQQMPKHIRPVAVSAELSRTWKALKSDASVTLQEGEVPSHKPFASNSLHTAVVFDAKYYKSLPGSKNTSNKKISIFLYLFRTKNNLQNKPAFF